MVSPVRPTFKNSSGVYLTKALFLETQDAGSDFSSVVYTLKSHDHRGYPSLKRLYLDCRDPTEYIFATRCLEDYDHFLKLSESSFFKPHLKSWRNELELLLRAEGIQRMISDAASDSKTSNASNKYLANAGWVQDKSQRGRPSKEELSQKLNEELSENRILREDARRIGIVVN